MSYFSDIAARNAPGKTDLLLPVQSGENTFLHDPFSESTLFEPVLEQVVSNDGRDNQNGTSDVPKSGLQVLPTKNSDTPGKIETSKRESIASDIVFSKVIENRHQFAVQNPDRLSATHTHSLHHIESKLFQAMPVSNKSETDSIKQPELVEPLNYTHKTLREIIQPLPPNDVLQSETVPLLQPQQKEQRVLPLVSQSPATATTHQQPKLTIGKITVEIVQPEKPAPSAQQSGAIHLPPRPQSSWNKHRSGLGQL